MKYFKVLKNFSYSLAIIALLPWVSLAFQSNTSFPVSASVIATCNVSTNPVIFVGYSGLSDVVAQGTIFVECAEGLSYQLSLDGGQHINLGKLSSSRALSDNNGNYISYHLYKPDYSGEWGDAGFSGTYPQGSVVNGIGNSFDESFTVNGRLFGVGRLVAPGPYNDIVIVTVHF